MTGKLRMYVSTNVVGSGKQEEVDLPDDWADMDEAARQEWIDEEWDTFLQNNLDQSYVVIEEDES